MKRIVPFLLLPLILAACFNDNLSELTPSSDLPGACDSTGVSLYSTQVASILNMNCGTANACHGSKNTSGYDLSTYERVNAVAVSGKLMSSINWTGSATRMPENGAKMNACNISKIQKWVDAGHLNN